MSIAEDPKPTDTLIPPTPPAEAAPQPEGALPTFEPSASLSSIPAASEQPSIGPTNVTPEADGIPTPPTPNEASLSGLTSADTAPKVPETPVVPPIDVLHPAIQEVHTQVVDAATSDAERAKVRIEVLNEIGQTLADPAKAEEIAKIIMKAHENVVGAMPLVKSSETVNSPLSSVASFNPSPETPASTSMLDSLPNAEPTIPAPAEPAPVDLPKAA